MADLRTELFGFALPHPVLAAAGPLTSTGHGMIEAAEHGAAGIVTITISPPVGGPARRAAPAPAKADRGALLNAGRWATLSVDDWIEVELAEALVAAGRHRIPLIASVGYEPEDLAKVVPALLQSGVDALELSCHRLDPEHIVDAARALKRLAGPRPVIAKLSANAPDIGALAHDLEPFIDGFACINAVGPGLRIDIETGRALLESDTGYGWLTGIPIRPIAIRAIYEVARRVSKPVIGVGGVSTGRDVAEMLMVGATCVQVCSAAVLEGPGAFGRIARELDAWLDANGYPSVDAVRGAYLQRWGHGQREVIEKEESPVVDAATCIGCTICERVCFYDAIEAPPKVIAKVFDAPCFQCGLCVSACPVDALSFLPRAQATLPSK